MAKHIFRPPSHRPYQVAIRKKFVVGTVFVAPPPVPTPGIAAKIQQDRVFKYYQLFRTPTEVRWQLQRRPYFSVAAAPLLPSSEQGFLAATRQQRKQLGKQYEIPPHFWRQRRQQVFGVAPAPPGVGEPGFLAATRQLRKQLGKQYPALDPSFYQRRFAVPTRKQIAEPGFIAAIKLQRSQFGFRGTLPDVQWRQRRQQIFGVAVVPPTFSEPGFLAAVQSLRKQLGKQREVFDVRRVLRQRQVAFGVGVPIPGFDIGWLVSHLVKRAYSHNLRR